MINQKLKICSICNHPAKLWKSSPAMCKNCAMRAKNTLVQSESGLEATPFKAYRTAEIKKVSTRQQKLNTAYNVQAKLYKKNNPVCKARIKCIGSPTTDVHHRRGRGQYLLDESTWLPTCRECHQWIETSPEQAKALGLSGSRLSKAI